MKHAPNTVLLNPIKGWACPLIPKVATNSLLKRCSDDVMVELTHSTRNTFLMLKDDFFRRGEFRNYRMFYVHRPDAERLQSYWRRAFQADTDRNLVRKLDMAGCSIVEFCRWVARERSRLSKPDGENIDEHIRPESCFICGLPGLQKVDLCNLEEFFEKNDYGELERKNQSER